MKPRPALVLIAGAVTLMCLLATVVISADPLLWKLVMVAVALGLPGALGAATQPHNPVGWLLLTVGVVFSALSLVTQWVEAGHQSHWAPWVADRAGAVVVPLTLLALMLLPDGRLPSPRWRPVTIAVVVAQTSVIAAWSLVAAAPGTPGLDSPNPFGVLPASWAGPVDTLGDWLLQAPFLLVLAAVGSRLRRREDRARLAGVLCAGAGFAVLAVAGRLLWASASDVLDIVGALLLGAGLTSTLLRKPAQVAIHQPGTTPALVETPELSVREREVLELVAQGLTNREIAERLTISPVTARNHVSNILTKLGLVNRTQAATWLSRLE